MGAKCIFTWSTTKVDNWVLKLGLLSNDKFIASTSSGSLAGYSLSKLASTSFISGDEMAHESSINDMKVINESTIVSCSTDGVNIWDIRAANKLVSSMTNSKNSNFLSLAYKDGLLAGGTELSGTDAEVHIWDIRNSNNSIVKSFVDSHSDDVTALEFHPTLKQYLMSGSTDGYVNIYDISKPDEDDALHQVINFGSVHSCHFLSESRVSILTHIETLMFHDMNNTNYEDSASANFVDLGDLRVKWPNNSYVVDLYPSGYIAYGNNESESLYILPFNPKKEQFKESKKIELLGAHGKEIVRDVLAIPNTTQCLTCGEDGNIKLWELPQKLKRYQFEKSKTSTSNSAHKDEARAIKKDHSSKSRKDRRFKPY
ncbi:hypothetical protein KGF56_003202 [Candida oxycetoniae]|uniref:WD repeat-containing protein 89 n=1 Tax=Candida oxycetoniae TaxID=497107 RepID=A0AAI9SVV9_9ASCO|nr:uncharacterized protein KGF56_003202 [Candida oxycetoniae]KAI3404043.2 hypothetical protein KGF56_003202 [Candida oxycetoniae]